MTIKYIIDWTTYNSKIEWEWLDYTITLEKISQDSEKKNQETDQIQVSKDHVECLLKQVVELTSKNLSLEDQLSQLRVYNSEQIRHLKDEVNYFCRTASIRLVVICVFWALLVFTSTILLYKS